MSAIWWVYRVTEETIRLKTTDIYLENKLSCMRGVTLTVVRSASTACNTQETDWRRFSYQGRNYRLLLTKQ